MQSISSVEESGSNHVAYYDLNNLGLYLSFAAPHNIAGPVPAYDRQYTYLDLKTIFSETQ